MVCDWSVAILEEAINDPSRGYPVRKYALDKLRQLVELAIDRGYAGLSKGTCRRLARQGLLEMRSHVREGTSGDIRAVEDLCDHLSQAVADGVFPELPDF